MGKVQELRIVHGIISALSWGLLIPLAIRWSECLGRRPQLTERKIVLLYVVFLVPFVLGLGGAIIGLWLGHHHLQLHKVHFGIAIILVILGFLKAYGFRFKFDALGWTLIILGIANVFEGFRILNPAKEWRIAYIVAVCVALVAAEVIFYFVAPYTMKGSIQEIQQREAAGNITTTTPTNGKSSAGTTSNADRAEDVGLKLV